MKIDYRELAEVSQAAGSNPSSATNTLQYLRGVSEDGIEEIGEEDVRGTETTHYRAEIDVDKVVEQLRDADISDDARELAEKGLEQFEGGTIPTDVWIDDDGRARRQDVEMRLRVEGETLDVRTRVEMFDFGVEVDVEAPPADEVVDISELLRGPPT
jgi:hypothetical protein